MNYDFNRKWLIKKFEEIRRRIQKALEQLDDEQVNWRPNEYSHSISTLIRHIEGNIQERITKGILHREIKRNRDEELSHRFISREELGHIVQDRFQFVIETVRTISDHELEECQIVRNKERTNLDMLHQCASHYSEHMGQIFYIAKQCLQEKYKSTSV
jgi:uncharacterized damage-inducible protein DinB